MDETTLRNGNALKKKIDWLKIHRPTEISEFIVWYEISESNKENDRLTTRDYRDKLNEHHLYPIEATITAIKTMAMDLLQAEFDRQLKEAEYELENL